MTEDALSALVALGLGYFAFRKWNWAAAKWIWVAGVAWFARHAASVWQQKSVFGRSFGTLTPVFWELSGHQLPPDTESFNNWTSYTLPLVRTVSYSIGAYCCANHREEIEGCARRTFGWFAGQWRAYREGSL